MAVVTRRSTRTCRLVCKGLAQQELSELYDSLKDELGVEAAFRNPFLPTFEPQTVHEIVVVGTAIAGTVGKKVLELIAELVKRKLAEGGTGTRQVTLYDYNDKPYAVVRVKPPKLKR